jgi:ketosteroid isomerase-like protein
MARTPQEIFEHHARALEVGNVDAILEDYAEDAVVITPQGTVRGKAAIREAFTGMLGLLPDATFDMRTQIFEDDVLFLEWSASGPTGRVTDGIDTFVFRGDQIRVQTLRFTLEPA